MKQDTPGLAKTACKLLMSLMNNEEIENNKQRYILPVEVIRRESTRKGTAQ